MVNEQVIERLRQEIKKNPAASAVFHVFALRKRARNQVTLRALTQKMQKEGFNFGQAEYAQVLKLMSELGFGKIITNKQGAVSGLTEIRTKLQSLGSATVGEGQVQKFQPRQKYVGVNLPVSSAPSPKIQSSSDKELALSIKALILEIQGKELTIPIPPQFTSDEVINLIKYWSNK